MTHTIIDLDAIVERAVTSAFAALTGQLAALVREAVKAALEERDADQIGGLSALAAWLGCSPGAAKSRLRKDAELAGLVLPGPGARRSWRRSEVLGLMARRRTERARRGI